MYVYSNKNFSTNYRVIEIYGFTDRSFLSHSLSNIVAYKALPTKPCLQIAAYKALPTKLCLQSPAYKGCLQSSLVLHLLKKSWTNSSTSHQPINKVIEIDFKLMLNTSLYL